MNDAIEGVQARNLHAETQAPSVVANVLLEDTTGVMPSEREGSQTDSSTANSGLSAMDSQALRRLGALLERNRNPDWVNQDLYRLLFMPDLYVMAYEQIKSKPGNMTKGADGTTLDGFSSETIEKIISKMRDETFQFQRARRVYIPKKSGGKRPLGVGSPTDKIVQAVLKMILEAIYDSPEGPTFREESHGFRPGRSPHTALQAIKRQWHGATWLIEGDIKGCFDNIDHEVLIGLLRKRVSDDRFLNLIRKALTAGYLEFKVPVDSVVGTPQGSVLSPLLANVYMHELDLYVETLRAKYEKREPKKVSKEYKKLTERIYKLRKALKEAPEEEREALMKRLNEETDARLNVPVYSLNGNFVTIKYVRYADDWIVGVNGPNSLARQLKNEIGEFLANTLKLTLSVEKTHIRHAKTEEAFFLGTRIRIGSQNNKVMYTSKEGTSVDGIKFRRRSTGWQPWLSAPIAKIIQRLAERDICYPDGTPKRVGKWTVLDDDQIVAQFRSVMLGYSNYYSFVDNRSSMHRIAYIVRFSCASTLASKHRITLRQAFAKFGHDLTVNVNTKKGPVVRSLGVPPHFRRTNVFMTGAGVMASEKRLQAWWNLRSRSKLGLDCVICGSDGDVQMHHIRHVRTMGHKLVGFSKLMAMVNRKQIPVCHECHHGIHTGQYDGVRLSQLYDPESFAR